MDKLIILILVVGCTYFYQNDLSTWFQKVQVTISSWLPDRFNTAEQAPMLINNETINFMPIEKQVMSVLPLESITAVDLSVSKSMRKQNHAQSDHISFNCWNLDGTFKQALNCRCQPLADDLKIQCHQYIRDEYLLAILERKL